MENMKTIECKIDGKNVKIQAKRSALFSKRVAAANVISEAVVSKDGEFRPWAFDVHFVIFILSAYSDFVFPENWGDNEISQFMRSESYKSILNEIDPDEIHEVFEWATDLIEYRKKCYENNVLSRMAEGAKEIFKTFQEELMREPEIVELLGSMIDRKNLQ